MIDNKKIEEAAINKCGFISSEFYSGAKWAIDEFLKDLWHPVSEKPERNTTYLVQTKDCIFETFYDSAEWEIFVEGCNITGWLYIDDFLPKKEGV